MLMVNASNMETALFCGKPHIVRDVPVELVAMVAAYLPTPSKYAIMLTCKALHGIIAPYITYCDHNM